MLSTKLKEAAGNSADATLYVDDVFSTWLYTGNGSTQTINNGIDLAGKGGLVWIKSRSAATDHKLTDTTRGATKALISDTTGAETTDTTGLTAFSSTGFSLGASSVYNTNAATYASWTFREAAKFFDVVTYTGTGSARTIAHSLGVAPGMVIVKRTDTTGNWQVYHRSLTSAANSIQLNSTAAQASAPDVWNSTAPTSSVFSVGTGATVNASGGTYVAYLYAHDTSSTGIIQCGSFTTDTSGAATVNLGWEPQYILSKCSSTTEGWIISDTMRGDSYGGTQGLFANTSGAEFNNFPILIPTATGFVSQNGQCIPSATYIYMAIRRPNKPPTSGTQVYLPISVTNSVGTDNTTGFAVDLQMNTLRSAAGKLFVDRLRGVSTTTTSTGIYLNSTNTNAESSGGAMTRNWGNTGFQTSDEYGSLSTIYWNFKRAPGFFDEVCWKFNGVDDYPIINHNLNVIPQLIFVKDRTDGATDWMVMPNMLASGYLYKLSLNKTDAISFASTNWWANADPTSTQFRVDRYYVGGNPSGAIPSSTASMVAYLFATLAGISKVGSYTGNGTGQAIACGFSAGARFVLIKRTDSTGNWYTFDSARGLTVGSSPYLLLNSNAAEVTGNNGVYASTGGFTLGSTASTTTNINAATYIFLAVA